MVRKPPEDEKGNTNVPEECHVGNSPPAELVRHSTVESLQGIVCGARACLREREDVQETWPLDDANRFSV